MGFPPPVWEQFMAYFSFQDLRNIFGLHKNVHFLGGIMVWPPHYFTVFLWQWVPSPRPHGKNSHFFPFSLTFLQNEHSWTKSKIYLGNTSQEKKLISFGHCPKKGGGPCPIFFTLFSTMFSLIFWHQYHVMWYFLVIFNTKIIKGRSTPVWQKLKKETSEFVGSAF